VSGLVSAQKILNYRDYQELAKYNRLTWIRAGTESTTGKIQADTLELYDEKGVNEFTTSWHKYLNGEKVETGDHKDLYEA